MGHCHRVSGYVSTICVSLMVVMAFNQLPVFIELAVNYLLKEVCNSPSNVADYATITFVISD